MKKILALLLALSAILVFASCEKDAASEKKTSSDKTLTLFEEMAPETTPEPEPEPEVKKARDVNMNDYPVAELDWTLENGVLTIRGTGKFPEYNYVNKWPWTPHKKEVTKIIVEEGLVNVGESAFYDFSKVTDVILPSSLVLISESAFGGCTKLPAIYIPEGVEAIGNAAFDACFNMNTVSLPSTLYRIGKNAFSHCDELYEITLPEGLEYLGENAFSSVPLSSIVLPSSLIEVGGGVFYNCYKLKSVTFNCEVDMPNLFREAKNIEEVNVSDYYIYENGVLYNKDKTLLIAAIDETITSLEIPDTVKKISEEALCYTNLSSVVIPSSVKEIGEGAFMCCKNLSSVVVENGLESIDKFAFAFCTNLGEINFPESFKSTAYGSFRGCNININFASEDVSFDDTDTAPNTVTNITYGA